MSINWFVISAFAVWRVTHLLHAEDGPWHIFARLRRCAEDSAWGEALGCFYCLSLWTSAPVALVLTDDWGERLLVWPAISGTSILLHKLTSAATYPNNLTANYYEAPEDPDALLRSEPTSVADPAR